MKNYFNFTLTGGKLLPVWLLLFFLVFVPLVFVQLKFETIDETSSEAFGQIFLWMLLIILLVLLQYAIYFYFIKLSIEGLVYKDKSFSFSGTFGKYIGILLLNFLLTIITFGIYFPWLITKLCKFFASNTEYDSVPFEFRGKGGSLFVIVLLTLILPMIFVGVIAGIIGAASAFSDSPHPDPTLLTTLPFLMILLVFVIIVPYVYYVYKWMINLQFRNQNIHWETNFWHSAGKIALELFLSLITLGIYLPAAGVKLYNYFADRTVAVSGTDKKRFGYDLETVRDFAFIWGQTLLTIITIGIYYPWAYSKITRRILSKTYVEVAASGIEGSVSEIVTETV